MLASPALKDLQHYPVTAGLAAASIVVTALWWSGHSIDALVMNGKVWSDWQLWRALTSTLPHVNGFHLLFNLYWLWKFGTLVERVFGDWRCAAIYLLLALGSSLAEFAFLSGGVGLSGVGYGLWGLLWVLSKRDARFAGAVDVQTNRAFITWFFLCILLTLTNVMPVANVAHGVGALLGTLLGFAISSQPSRKWKSVAGLTAVLLVGLVGSTLLWPYVTFSTYAEAEVERAGLDAMARGNYQGAARLLETATGMRHSPARAWYNCGIAYQHLQRYAEAAAAYQHAARMPDAEPDMQRIAEKFELYLSLTNRIH